MEEKPNNFMPRVFLAMAGISILAFAALFYVVMRAGEPELPDDAFFRAARYSDITILENMYARDQGLLNRTDDKGMTALFHAIEGKQTAALQWLLNKQARLDVKDKLGRDAFELAKETHFEQGLSALDSARLNSKKSN